MALTEGVISLEDRPALNEMLIQHTEPRLPALCKREGICLIVVLSTHRDCSSVTKQTAKILFKLVRALVWILLKICQYQGPQQLTLLLSARADSGCIRLLFCTGILLCIMHACYVSFLKYPSKGQVKFLVLSAIFQGGISNKLLIAFSQPMPFSLKEISSHPREPGADKTFAWTPLCSAQEILPAVQGRCGHPTAPR